MDIKQVEIFIRVAETGNFTKVARALNITQPAISWQIKSLESQLGLPLFERQDRNAVLTEAGAIFLEYARRMLALHQEALQAIEEYQGLRSGKLVVGASTIPGEYLLPAFLGRFRQLYPRVEVKLRIADTGAVIDWLALDEIHLGIIGALPATGQLETTSLWVDELVYVVSPGHPLAGKGPVTLEQAVREPLVMREKESGTRMVIGQMLAAAGVDNEGLTVSLELGSTRAVLTAVAAGLGASWVSRCAAAESLALGTVNEVAIAGGVFERGLFLATRRGRYLSPVARAFMDYLLGEKPN